MSKEIKKILDNKKVQYAIMGLLPNQAEHVISAMKFVSQKTTEKIFKKIDKCIDQENIDNLKFEILKKEFGVYNDQESKKEGEYNEQ